MSGAGSQRCSYLTSRTKPGSHLQESSITGMVFGWAQGFMSGMNAGKADTGFYFDLSSVSIEEQWAFITEYCRQNPSKQIVDAVIELVSKRLQPRKLR
jgi:hypothetical protein